MQALEIRAGANGLQAGQELTFFYPSTEWAMDQAFACLCGSKSCLGWISGAGDMPTAQLERFWLNAYIWEMVRERDAAGLGKDVAGNGKARRGVGSRELSGEMGGDTIVA
jgi:hypothetical protein